MSGYRITLFADPTTRSTAPRCTQEVIDEIEHMLRLYQEDGVPALSLTVSAVTPLPDTPGAHHA